MFPGRKSLNSVPKVRIELHAHLDGCVRHETIWELMKDKQIPLPGNGTFRDLQQALVVRDPKDLAHFLQPFNLFTPCIVEDFDAMERVAYEFCEDRARNGVLYVEARYTPHLWLRANRRGDITALSRVVSAVSHGFERAQELGVKARSILCVLNGMGIASDILALCQQFRDKGVVGIDMATPSSGDTPQDEVPLSAEEMRAFDEARKLGIHRTMHAGETGGAVMVERALKNYYVERIGHGYHVVQDSKIYSDCRKQNVHFECCPWSSFLTGSVPLNVAKHPIAQFAEDNVNFSLNTDDTTITGVNLQDEYDLVKSWGLSEVHLTRANMNALRSSFLTEEEKSELKTVMLSELGVVTKS